MDPVTFIAELVKEVVRLFIIVSPFGAVPLFLSMTELVGRDNRRRTALYAALTTAAILGLACLLGETLFRFFGITLASFRIAGGILLFIYAMDMVQFRSPRMKSTDAEVEAGAAAQEVGIIPLGIPMLAGPGAIATVMVQRLEHPGAPGLAIVAGAVALVAGSVWLAMILAVRAQRWLSPVVLGIIIRLEGLLLSAIACEMVVAGIIGAFHLPVSG